MFVELYSCWPALKSLVTCSTHDVLNKESLMLLAFDIGRVAFEGQTSGGVSSLCYLKVLTSQSVSSDHKYLPPSLPLTNARLNVGILEDMVLLYRSAFGLIHFAVTVWLETVNLICTESQCRNLQARIWIGR